MYAVSGAGVAISAVSPSLVPASDCAKSKPNPVLLAANEGKARDGG